MVALIAVAIIAAVASSASNLTGLFDDVGGEIDCNTAP